MKEDLDLYGNVLVEFTTFFSIGYAIVIIPSQMTQTLIRPSSFLPTCEIIWGCLIFGVSLFLLFRFLHIFTGWMSMLISVGTGYMLPLMRGQSMRCDSFSEYSSLSVLVFPLDILICIMH